MALRTVAAPSPGCSMPACSRIQPSIFTCHMRSRSSAAQIVQRERRQAGGLLPTRGDTLLNQALEPASFGAGVIETPHFHVADGAPQRHLGGLAFCFLVSEKNRVRNRKNPRKTRCGF